MDLSGWLERTRTPRSAFARAVGVSPGRITQICEGELPSLELAERIARETAGAVTPNDFLGLVPSQQWINSLMTDTQRASPPPSKPSAAARSWSSPTTTTARTKAIS